MLDTLQRHSYTSTRVEQKPTGPRRESFSERVIEYFDSIGKEHSLWRSQMAYYVQHTREFLQKVIPADKKILLIGCLSPEILESLNPSVGVGLDVSERLIRRAKDRNTQRNISYVCSLPENYSTHLKFDYVVLLNHVDYSEDLTILMKSLKGFTHADSKVVISMLNPLWHPFIRLASRLRIRIPDCERNLVAAKSLQNILEIQEFRVNEICRRVLVPKPIPLLSQLFNQFLSRLPILNSLCFIQYVIAQPAPREKQRLSCSVIIPCYNEEGNIAECVRRVPNMGDATEILVVNDGSQDNTQGAVRSLQKKHPNVTLITYEKNKGKGRAVLEGMKRANGDILMILDADMTVPPEEMVDFYEAIQSGAAEFVSGTRFLYPMEQEAMRLTNFVGNHLFSKLVQIIVGAEYSDTLCGTKAFLRSQFADFRLEDPRWGDFDLIFHAARRKLRCMQIPVHYKSRIHGVSKMKAFSSGISFLKLCFRKWAVLP